MALLPKPDDRELPWSFIRRYNDITFHLRTKSQHEYDHHLAEFYKLRSEYALDTPERTFLDEVALLIEIFYVRPDPNKTFHTVHTNGKSIINVELPNGYL